MLPATSSGHMLGLFTHQRVAKAWKRFLHYPIQSLTVHLSCVTPCARYQMTSLIARPGTSTLPCSGAPLDKFWPETRAGILVSA